MSCRFTIWPSDQEAGPTAAGRPGRDVVDAGKASGDPRGPHRPHRRRHPAVPGGVPPPAVTGAASTRSGRNARRGPVHYPAAMTCQRRGRAPALITRLAGLRAGTPSHAPLPRPRQRGNNIRRSGCLRAERHCRCDRARRLILWRRARSRRDGYDLLACAGLPPVRRDHPEAGLTHTRKAVASLRRTCPAPDAPAPAGRRTAR